MSNRGYCAKHELEGRGGASMNKKMCNIMCILNASVIYYTLPK